MDLLPLRKNTVTLVTLAMLAALGIIIRLTIRFTIIPELVEITPAFLFSLLAGVIGGIPGGIFVGGVVGLGGALAGGEFPLIPMLGNIMLGVGTGWVIHVLRDRDSLKYVIFVILGGGLIGGFISDMIVFAILGFTFDAALPVAIADMIQAFAWVVVALIVERTIIRPLAGHYLYPTDSMVMELDEEEV